MNQRSTKLIVGSLLLVGFILFLLLNRYFLTDDVPVPIDVGTSVDEPFFPEVTVFPVSNISGLELRNLEVEVTNQFEEFLKADSGKTGWKQFIYDDQVVPISVGLPALGVVVNSDVGNLLDQARWGVHSCASAAAEPEYVLRIQVKLLPDYEGDLYKDEKSYMRAWESTLLKDTQSVLFPQLFYSSVTSNNVFIDSHEYKLEGVRQSSVNTATAGNKQMAYQIVGDYILIGSDIDCMVGIGNTLVDMVP